MSQVLVIEADQVLAENLKLALRRAGHKAIWHQDLQAAIESVDEDSPEVIVMDLITAGHSGIEFLYELRSYSEWQSLPVVLYSSLAPQELLGLDQALEDLDISAFHYKPKSTLAEVISSVNVLAVRA
ncbi:hypothetical protein A3E49_01040 [Candidatus Saccharibacteria bacterium RIFCSPHIGHO2_12_FULL_49_19]|nr:MAG: hypothetical protein A2708_01165 [Candidatus Saccharibacteria bacterium RIFCSPHIGHO2_01_FULL_49_21]OGL36868.1 MAG: hypothetical protein A3E49_01040 [Candidatus Saccharibacteria bacterium RIFCSPHIGHO2_12_FULL_49_19]